MVAVTDAGSFRFASIANPTRAVLWATTAIDVTLPTFTPEMRTSSPTFRPVASVNRAP